MTSAHAVPNSTRRCERGFLTKQKSRVWVFCNYFLLFCLLLGVLCTDLLLPRLLRPDQAAPHHRCQRGARPSLSRWPEPPEHWGSCSFPGKMPSGLITSEPSSFTALSSLPSPKVGGKRGKVETGRDFIYRGTCSLPVWKTRIWMCLFMHQNSN